MDEMNTQTASERPMEKGIHLRYLVMGILVVTAVISAIFIMATMGQIRSSRELADSSSRYMLLQKIISDVETASNYLTDQARAFSTIGDRESVDHYFTEKQETLRREKSLEIVSEEIGEGEILSNLTAAVEKSHELEQLELYSMRLVIEATYQDVEDYPQQLKDVELEEADLELSAYEQWRKASMMLHDADYDEYKSAILAAVSDCQEMLMEQTRMEELKLAKEMNRLVILQAVTAAGIILTLLGVVLVIVLLLMRPLNRIMERIQKHEELPLEGAYELQAVCRTYNDVFIENADIRDRLSYEASHDSLTGLLNRRIFEDERAAISNYRYGLLLVDVDYFKSVNDQFGHDVGDQVLRRVAAAMKKSFRSDDLVCRIGGDEFAVILKNVTFENCGAVEKKLSAMQEELRTPVEGLPPVTLSMGMAFSDGKVRQSDLFKDADIALFQAKGMGRDRYVIRGKEAE